MKPQVITGDVWLSKKRSPAANASSMARRYSDRPLAALNKTDISWARPDPPAAGTAAMARTAVAVRPADARQAAALHV
jgi:hypothetical protein